MSFAQKQSIRYLQLTFTASNWPDGLCTALHAQYVRTQITDFFKTSKHQ